MKTYDLVIRGCNDKCNYFDDKNVIINGKSLNNIYDIDRFTSSLTFDDLWNIVSKENKLDGFKSLVVRVVDGANITYKDIIINNKIINSCVNDIVDGNINKNNSYFKEEVRDFLRYINDFDVKIIKNGLNGIDDKDLFLLIDGFKKNNDNDICDKLVDSFSNYMVFRKWISNKEIINKKGINNNYIKDYYRNNMDFVRRFNCFGGEFIYSEDIEEFLTKDELEMMGVIDNSSSKVRSKRL